MPRSPIAIHRVSDREAAIHLIRYDYDETRDEVPVIDRMTLEVRLPRPLRSVRAFDPTGDISARVAYGRDGVHRIELEDVPLYSVISLR